MIRWHLKTLASLATPFGLPVLRYEGALHGSREQACILAAASLPTADFVAGSLMSIERRQQVLELPSPFALRGAAIDRLSADADLVAAELPWLWRFLMPAGAGLRFPAWVSQEIRAPAGAALAVPSAARKEAMRHARRENYSVELSRDSGRIDEFYREFYRPYVTQRFGSGALVVEAEQFHAVSRGMTLAMLRAGGDWTAGMLFRLSRATLQLGWFGSRTHPPRCGASEMLDAWVIAHAAENGARRAVLGHSRPSLADGVVRYKARFGAVVRATRFPQRVVGIDVRRPRPAVANALNAARFVAFAGGRPELRELRFRPAL
jgi:hypothetical protein